MGDGRGEKVKRVRERVKKASKRKGLASYATMLNLCFIFKRKRYIK